MPKKRIQKLTADTSQKFDAIWKENNYTAEVKIIRKHSYSIDMYLVEGAFGEHWVSGKNLHFR